VVAKVVAEQRRQISSEDETSEYGEEEVDQDFETDAEIRKLKEQLNSI
jgi:hypothetical protein